MWIDRWTLVFSCMKGLRIVVVGTFQYITKFNQYPLQSWLQSSLTTIDTGGRVLVPWCPMVDTKNGRWHYRLEPTLFTHSPDNAFPNGIGRFLHPTRATLASKDPDRDEEFLWKSRDHRKNRHVKYTPNKDRSRHGKNLLVGIEHMTRLEYWNVSWWVATVSSE